MCCCSRPTAKRRIGCPIRAANRAHLRRDGHRQGRRGGPRSARTASMLDDGLVIRSASSAQARPRSLGVRGHDHRRTEARGAPPVHGARARCRAAGARRSSDRSSSAICRPAQTRKLTPRERRGLGVIGALGWHHASAAGVWISAVRGLSACNSGCKRLRARSNGVSIMIARVHASALGP